ncbi:TatD family hydrolase, partial [Buchnera aphidicola]|nr:TatD family hydrolase [Buchnera aphidicola]
MLLIDSHCHIDRLNYHLLHKNLDDVLKKAYKNNVFKILAISTSINNFFKIQKIIEKQISIFCS